MAKNHFPSGRVDGSRLGMTIRQIFLDEFRIKINGFKRSLGNLL